MPSALRALVVGQIELRHHARQSGEAVRRPMRDTFERTATPHGLPHGPDVSFLSHRAGKSRQRRGQRCRGRRSSPSAPRSAAGHSPVKRPDLRIRPQESLFA